MMNKKLSFLALVFLLLLIIGCNRRTPVPIAQAPAMQQALEEALPEEKNTGASELRNVMPNSWHMLTRLTPQEEQAFMQENSAVFAEIESRMNRHVLDWFGGSRFEHYFIFRQHVGTDTFHRVVVTESSNPDFLSAEIRFFQFLVYENMLLAIGPYNSINHSLLDTTGAFISLDIIPGRENAKGILITTLMVRRDSSNPYEWCASAFRNGQLYGINRANFYLMEDALKYARGERFTSIRIDASDCLVDPDIPLRYSLQNAFDGNPKTAFIANPESGLMSISFTGTGSSVIRIAIINGYTYDYISYKNNNRIKTISIFINGAFHGVELTDNTLSWQFSEIDGFGNFSVRDIIRGNKFNRTVISGYNVYSTEHGWLFGVISE